MSLYDRIVGAPWVYNHVRPFLLGGIDLSPAFALLGDTSQDVVLDIGCGTGVALRYLKNFAEYYGFDPDARTVAYAAQKYQAPNIHLRTGLVGSAQIARVQPTKVLLMSVLHHLSDDEVKALLGMLAGQPSLRQIATLDVVYLEGQPINNLLARLDRGRFVRTLTAMRVLVTRAGFSIERSELVCSGNHLSRYFITDLRPTLDHG